MTLNKRCIAIAILLLLTGGSVSAGRAIATTPSTSLSEERILTDIVFPNDLQADIDVSTLTAVEVQVTVPSGVEDGVVRAMTTEGDSNPVPFVAWPYWTPDRETVPNTSAITYSGQILADTVWDADILVTGDVSVESGTTLTIAPGVKVFFAVGSDDQAGGYWTDRTELHVHGTVIAEGTQEAPIHFTSNAGEKAPGDWGAIIIRTNSTDSSFTACVIRYAEYGIWFRSYDEGSGTMSALIRNCTIADNVRGLYMWGSGQSASTVTINPMITTNLVEDNAETGIHMSTSGGWGTSSNYAVIHNNVIQSNATGVYLHANAHWLGHVDNYPEIRNNTIRANLDYGIYVVAHGSDDTSGSDVDVKPTVENNLLSDNGQTNIHLFLTPDGSDGTQILQPIIRYNTIRNAPSGIAIEDDEPYDTLTPTISHNVLYGFDGTGAYAINNLTSRAIDAKQNYWGDSEAVWDAGPASGVIGGAVDTSAYLNTSSLPVLTRIEPASGVPGDRVTIHGANFGTGPILYLPLVMRNHAVPTTFPLYIGDPIPRRSVAYQGEVFYAKSLRIPDTLPLGGHYFLSSQPDTIAEVLVDDELAIILNGVQLYAYDFSTGGSPVPAVVALPHATMDQLPGQIIVVEYRDVHGHAVQASTMWLIWVP